MILIAKHLALMSLALWLLPLLGRWFARTVGHKVRLRRPAVTWSYIALRLLIALVIPIVAQEGFALTGNRFLILALTGALYGATFGHAEDFPLVGAALWGALGGFAAAFTFGSFAPTSEARALCVAIFAVTPLLAYRPVTTRIRSKLAAGGLIVPSRRVLR